MMVSHRSQRIEMLSRNGVVRGLGVRRKTMKGAQLHGGIFPLFPHVSRRMLYMRHGVDLGKIALLRCRNFEPGLG
jgi:hypothetical protein